MAPEHGNVEGDRVKVMGPAKGPGDAEMAQLGSRDQVKKAVKLQSGSPAERVDLARDKSPNSGSGGSGGRGE